MSYLEAILLGLIQGLTEFLPVSSSGHLAFAKQELGWSAEGSLAFSVVVHLATLLAVVIAYHRALWRILAERRRAVIPLFLATSVLSLVLPIKDLLESLQGNPWLIAGGFCLSAVLLLVADPPGRPPRPAEDEETELERLSPRTALAVGVAQLCAVMEGVSRSGSTIAVGIVCGASRPLAAEFAFLLAIPAILGAAVLEAKDIGHLAESSPGPLLAGFLTALITGVLAIYLLQWLLKIRRFWVFAPYLLVMAGVTLWRGRHWPPL